MAVEAHHLHLLPSFQPIPNTSSREFMGGIDNQAAAIYSNIQMGFGVSGATGNLVPFCNSTPVDAAESGLTFNGLSISSSANLHQRKRPRCGGDEAHHQGLTIPSFVGHNIFSFLQQQQQLDVDRLIASHVERVKAELWERRRRFVQRVAAAVEEGLHQRLKAKEEEIEHAVRLNAALHERVRSLSVENQIWRDLARTNEAAVQALRTNLEQALTQQQGKINVHGGNNNNDDADDVESCCDNNHVQMAEGGGYREDVGVSTSNKGGGEEEVVKRRKVVCRVCWKEEPSVLVLPCRHLSLCSSCSSQSHLCPICSCTKQCTVHVNLS